MKSIAIFIVLLVIGLVCLALPIEGGKKAHAPSGFVPKVSSHVKASLPSKGSPAPLTPEARKEWILSLGAVRLAHLIQHRVLTSAEVVSTFLENARLVNAEVNAITCWNDHALEEAAELDLLLQNGTILGRFHGVPITVKDHIAVNGMLQTWCTTAFASHVADKDATAVTRMKQAGAVIIGKTTMPPLGLAFDTAGAAFGITNNAYDRTRSAGGSSGGEGAIIAARGSPLGIGSDVGGSLRIPAAWNGLCSIKPTQGRIPTTGSAFPPLGEIWEFMEHSNDCFTLGPMSRFVEDLEVALEVMSGTDNVDWQARLPAWHSRVHKVDVTQLRFGHYAGDGVTTATPDIVDAINLVVETLRQRGAASITDMVSLPLLSESQPLLARLITKDGCPGAMHIMQAEPYISGPLKPLVDLCPVFKVDTRAEVDALHLELSQMRSKFSRVFADYDVLIGPANLQPAPFPEELHSGESVRMFTYTIGFNVGQIPAVIVSPVSLAKQPEYAGLPVGVQLAFAPHNEHLGLAVARLLQDALAIQQYAPVFHHHAHEHDGAVHDHPHAHDGEHAHPHDPEAAHHAHTHAHGGSVHDHDHAHDGEHAHPHDVPVGNDIQ